MLLNTKSNGQRILGFKKRLKAKS